MVTKPALIIGVILSPVFATYGSGADPSSPPVSQPSAAAGVWIRASQIGYLPDEPKVALLSSDGPQEGSFTVGEFSGPIGKDHGPWGPFRHNYRLDFSSLTKEGRYQVRAAGTTSLPFTIGRQAYADVSPKLIHFMRLQRCGHNPITGRRCHQEDAVDTVTGFRHDLVGGWHDAADRIKHMITTTYCVAALYLAGEPNEANYGAELVRKTHPDPNTMYVQIGDDRDHGRPAKLWHEDETDYGWGKGGPRAAWPATGKPEGPKYKNRSSGMANLAGRAAAAMALAGDLKTAQSLYALARKYPGNAMSVPVKAPYYYGESTFSDDLEWAAVELYIATGDKSYLDQAIAYARQAGPNPGMGGTRHGHYELFPYVNLAHWRLYPHVDDAVRKELAGFYRAGLNSVRRLAEQNPYRLGTPLVWCSCNDVIALATQAVLYERMTGDATFRPLATEARDWIFGRNPWGVSMVIGVPETGNPSRHPHHLFYRLANILPVGGLVDGPVYKEINDQLRFEDFGQDVYARFQSDIGVYHDVYADFATNEPIIDGTVSLLLLLSVWP